MLRTSIAVAALFIFISAPLCFAQDKPADAPGLPGAKSINLQLVAASPDEAFAELAKQAGVQIKPMGQSQTLWAKADPVELKVDNGRFWPVLIDMCQQANVRFNPMYSQGEPRTVLLFGAEQGMDSITKSPYVEVQGCVIALISATRSNSLNYANPKQSQSGFDIQAMFLGDPGADLGGNPQAVVTEAVDENGNSFVQPDQQQRFYSGADRRSLSRNLRLYLNYPANAGKKLVRLKGEVRASVVTKSEMLTIDSPTEAEPQKKALATMSVEIRSIKTVASMIEVQVVIRPPQPIRGTERQNMLSLLSALDLIDIGGNHYSQMGFGQTAATPDAITAMVRFGNRNPGQPLGKPDKLTWTLPVETQEIRLPFEFKDLPIP